MAEEKLLWTKAFCQEIKEKDGTVSRLFIASDDVEDRQGETISVDGWQLENFKKQPSILWGHEQNRPLIGKAKKIGYKTVEGSKRLVFEPEFHRKDEFSRLIADLVDEGWIKSSSVGFLPKETDEEEKKYLKQELLEISFVNVPANPNALGLAFSKGYSPEVIKKAMPDMKVEEVERDEIEKPYPHEHACRLRNPDDFKPDSFRRVSRTSDGKKYDIIMGRLKDETTMTEQAYRYNKEIWTEGEAKSHCGEHKGSFEPATENKAVIPYAKYPLSSSDTWDAGREVRGAEVADLKKMCAWYDSEKPDIKTSYKLPHHELSGYKTNWQGVAAAMAALLGARGGVDIPDADKRRVYGHLTRHYDDFDKEPPEFRMADEVMDRYVEGRSAEDLVSDLTKTVNVFIEEMKKDLEGRKAIAQKNAEDFAKDIGKRFENIELNVKGLTEGISPTDKGLEQRFLDMEANIYQLADGVKAIVKELSSVLGEKGREPLKATDEKKVIRHKAMKVLNRAVEALNQIK